MGARIVLLAIALGAVAGCSAGPGRVAGPVLRDIETKANLALADLRFCQKVEDAGVKCADTERDLCDLLEATVTLERVTAKSDNGVGRLPAVCTKQ